MTKTKKTAHAVLRQLALAARSAEKQTGGGECSQRAPTFAFIIVFSRAGRFVGVGGGRAGV